MFGKIMSISDELMWRYYDLLSFIPVDEIKQLRGAASKDKINPRDIKLRLASELVERFHGKIHYYHRYACHPIESLLYLRYHNNAHNLLIQFLDHPRMLQPWEMDLQLPVIDNFEMIPYSNVQKKSNH